MKDLLVWSKLDSKLKITDLDFKRRKTLKKIEQEEYGGPMVCWRFVLVSGKEVESIKKKQKSTVKVNTQIPSATYV